MVTRKLIVLLHNRYKSGGFLLTSSVQNWTKTIKQMTKEEKIKEAWVKVIGLKNYEIVKNDICENGTIYEYHLRKIKYKFSDDFIFIDNGDNEPDEMQLQSLQGIENNNGWTKIESEWDLPKEKDIYWTINKSGNIEKTTYYGKDDLSIRIWEEQITHYQPIQKPQPPIY